MPTVNDVARRAGVAPITVSRVINNSGYFSEATRERVQAAIAELGYVPNRLARSLRTKRSQVLALVITDISNPFFTTVARGVEDAAGAAGYTVTYCNTDESESKENKYLDLLIQQQVDGILLVPARSTAESVNYLQQHGKQVVVLDRRVPGAETDVVRCDSEDGAYRLTRLLLDLGHRRIAIWGGPEGVSTAEDRLAGYRRALIEASMEPDPELILTGSFTQSSGRKMARTVISTSPRPTALLAANNFIALGALKAVVDSGLKVPGDIALVAFDDLPQALIIHPFLTVATQPAYQMAQQGTQLLLARLKDIAAGKELGACQEIVLPVNLIVRRSSGEAVVS
jgi:LacI family transcriptional regulator